MADKKRTFPQGFVWGTSTAGHQVEGHNYNTDWWKFEQEGKIKDGTKTGVCMDYWNRYEEDHDLMVKLGYQAFRLGIEWGKIEPHEGQIDHEAIARYKQILQSLRDHNLKICLTLYHWVLPLWFAEAGGWMNSRAVDKFVKYCEIIVKEFAEFPDLWCTLNEPLMPPSMGYLTGEFPPEHKSFKEYGHVTYQLLCAHARVYELIHKTVHRAPDGGPVMAGVATAYQHVEGWGTPGPAGLIEKLAAKLFVASSFGGWDKAIKTGTAPIPFGPRTVANLKDSYDYCGANYYMRNSVKFDLSRPDQGFLEFQDVPEGIESTQFGWQIYPPGLYHTLMNVWNTFKKPIYILENGIADDCDAQRPKYLLEHLTQVHRAITSGADVRGYYQWSYMDNFEWKEGFSKKFGLVAVDHTDPALKRKPRPSAYMYGDIIRENGITEDIVNKYAPSAKEGVFGNKWMK